MPSTDARHTVLLSDDDVRILAEMAKTHNMVLQQAAHIVSAMGQATAAARDESHKLAHVSMVIAGHDGGRCKCPYRIGPREGEPS